ncbi:MAG: hypothetical protein AB1498_00505 [bacterium]
MFDEIKRVLITIKAYPNPSKKYGETVCVAGVDIDTHKWIRLYPIPFRDLDENKKFKKYNIIEVKVEKSKDDHRPESFKIDTDSIKILNHFDTVKDKKWNQRKEIVFSHIDKSMCEILKENESNKKSLGIFKPANIEFFWEKAAEKDESDREACYAQHDLFKKEKNVIENIPFDFRYKFKCSEKPDCPGHDYLIIDWEIGQSYRSWRNNYSSQELLLEKIKERWYTRICSDKNDIYFFVGNMKRFPNNFMILGTFYPPKI